MTNSSSLASISTNYSHAPTATSTGAPPTTNTQFQQAGGMATSSSAPPTSSGPGGTNPPPQAPGVGYGAQTQYGGSATTSSSGPVGQPKRLHVSNIPFRFREPDLRNLFYVSVYIYIALYTHKVLTCIYC